MEKYSNNIIKIISINKMNKIINDWQSIKYNEIFKCLGEKKIYIFDQKTFEWLSLMKDAFPHLIQ